MLKKIWEFIAEITKVIVVSFLIILPIRYYIIQPFYVKGASMEPNFHGNNYLIVDKISYRFHDIKRGDPVVFHYPANPREYFIKRVVALPGESVKIKDGDVYIYNEDYPKGIILNETDYLGDRKTYSIDNQVITLAPDEYYVLGDNRGSSKDSRSFGPVGRSFIIGKVFFRGWPVDEIKFFLEEKTYNF